MNDYELNRAITRLVFPNCKPKSEYTHDYCNNWNDLMPLIIKHEISLYWDFFNWTAYKDKFYSDGEFFNTNHYITLINSQRALAECLLAVLEKNEILLKIFSK